MRTGFEEKIIIIDALSDKRGPAKVAQTLYTETEQSSKSREQRALERKALLGNRPPEQRPDKRARKKIQHIKGFRDHLD